MSDHGSASMDMLPPLSNPESHLITMCYILMEPTLHTAISVDFSRLLLQHTKQQPKAKPEKKHTSDDTGGGDGGDGSEDPEARLRCYVRFSTQHLRWIVEYAYVEPDQTNYDMDRSSTLLGFGIELALRFTNPPCTGAEHFKWPAERRSVAVFRCMEDGSLEQLQRGDPAIVKRKFFRVGQPTVRSEGWMPGPVCAVWAVERLYCSRAPGLAKQEEWEEELGEEEGMPSLEVRSGLEKRKNNSLTSFLEFVGVTQSYVSLYVTTKRYCLINAL